ncbi:hypothetical protein A5686_20335 [Mycobacterium sp. E2479]|nr:hypothetical protein A5686_20335 [Mycobacterium sp. E2479]
MNTTLAQPALASTDLPGWALLHTLGAVSVVETGVHLRRQQALATKNQQPLRAIATRDVVGQPRAC